MDRKPFAHVQTPGQWTWHFCTRALAITTAERAAFLPDTPPIAEYSLDKHQMAAWFAMFASRETPQNIIDTINKTVNEVLKSAKIKQLSAKIVMGPAGRTDKIFRLTNTKKKKARIGEFEEEDYQLRPLARNDVLTGSHEQNMPQIHDHFRRKPVSEGLEKTAYFTIRLSQAVSPDIRQE